MKNFILLMILTTVSCSKSDDNSSSKPRREVNTETQTTPADNSSNGRSTTGGSTTGVPTTPTVTIRVQAEFVDINDLPRLDKLKKAVQLMERVLNLPTFRNRIRLYKYENTFAFIDNEGKTNQQILDTLKDGSELLRPGNDHTANLKLTLYYSSSSTVGYTTPQTMLIKINRKFFDDYDIAHVACNLTHEWTHKLGFDHSSRYNTDRDHSVPYAVGYLMRDMGEDLINEGLILP
jgi:hypothetical protein